MLRNRRVRDPLLRGYHVRELFDEQLRSMPKPLWKRLKYYRTHVAPGVDALRLRGYYTGTALDGNKDAYREYLHAYADHAADSATAATPPTDPETWQAPLRLYDPTSTRGTPARSSRAGAQARNKAC